MFLQKRLERAFCGITMGFHFSPIRAAIALRAVSQSVLQELRSESLEKELQLWYGQGSRFHSLDSALFVEQTSLYACCFLVGVLGLRIWYGSDDKQKKWEAFEEYQISRRSIRLMCLLVLLLFFRNVENAI